MKLELKVGMALLLLFCAVVGVNYLALAAVTRSVTGLTDPTVAVVFWAAVMVGSIVGSWLAVTRWLAFALESEDVCQPSSRIEATITLLIVPVVFGVSVTALSEYFELTGISTLVGLYCFAYAVVYNAIPGHNRRFKYLVLFSGALCAERTSGAWTALIVLYVAASLVSAAISRVGSKDGRLGPLARRGFLRSMSWSGERARATILFLVAPLAFLYSTLFVGISPALIVRISSLMFLVAVAPVGVVHHELLAASALDRLTVRHIGPAMTMGQMIVILAAVPFIATVVRYYTKNSVASRPILYLRSFGDTRLTGRLKELVAPLTGIAVVRCLVHHTQRAAAIQLGLPASAFMTSIYSNDVEWKSWIEVELDRCAGVLFDFSDGIPSKGSGLAWEFEFALGRVSPERIAVIVSEKTIPLTTEAVRVVQYAHANCASARKELMSWATKIT